MFAFGVGYRYCTSKRMMGLWWPEYCNLDEYDHVDWVVVARVQHEPRGQGLGGPVTANLEEHVHVDRDRYFRAF